jgi:hypothetical protein
MLAMNVLCNTFSRRSMLKQLLQNAETVMGTISYCFAAYPDANKLLLSASALAMNIALVMREANVASTYNEQRVIVFSGVTDLLDQLVKRSAEQKMSDPDVVYRLLVTIGTLLYNDAGTRDIANALQVYIHTHIHMHMCVD